MSAACHNASTARIQSRLERWELDHLRSLCASQAAQLEDLRAQLYNAEDAADFWRSSHHSLEDHLTEGTEDARCIGLTTSGELLVVRTGATQ